MSSHKSEIEKERHARPLTPKEHENAENEGFKIITLAFNQVKNTIQNMYFCISLSQWWSAISFILPSFSVKHRRSNNSNKLKVPLLENCLKHISLISLTTGPVITYWARNGALVFRLWLASLSLIQFGGVAWRLQSHWLLSLGIPRRISSNCQYKQVRLVMRSTLVFFKRCFNHLVWHKMLLSYNLNKVEMKLYYKYIYYHSQAYDCLVCIKISFCLVRCSAFKQCFPIFVYQHKQ